jgi:hypothetical protein
MFRSFFVSKKVYHFVEERGMNDLTTETQSAFLISNEEARKNVNKINHSK